MTVMEEAIERFRKVEAKMKEIRGEYPDLTYRELKYKAAELLDEEEARKRGQSGG